MAAKTKSAKLVKNPVGTEFVITREFDAPRELVWLAWTDAKHLAQWWGPKGFSNPICDWEPRVGNKIYVVMRAPNGAEFPMGGEFREIKPPEKLVTVTGALDEKGKLLFEFLHTMTLAENKGKTKLTMHSRVIMTTTEASKYIGGFEGGMTLSLERLGAHLAQKTEPLILERTFDAPVALVWKAITTKEDMGEWSFEIKAFKPEVGFEFQFIAGKEGGTKFDHRCKITEVIPQKRLVYTWRYEGYKGESLVSFDLIAEGDKTRLKLTHLNLETFPQVPDFARSNFNRGWTYLIGECLKQFVETGSAPQ